MFTGSGNSGSLGASVSDQGSQRDAQGPDIRAAAVVCSIHWQNYFGRHESQSACAAERMRMFRAAASCQGLAPALASCQPGKPGTREIMQQALTHSALGTALQHVFAAAEISELDQGPVCGTDI